MMPLRRVFLVIVGVVLVIGGSSLATRRATAQDQNSLAFKTPEEAITYSMQALAQGDVPRLLQAYAINEMAQNFKFAVLVDRLQTFLPVMSGSPSEYPMFVEINKAQFTADILRQVRFLVYGLLSTTDVTEAAPIYNLDAAKFVKEVDPQQLATIELKKIGRPNQKVMNSSTYLKNEATQAQIYGADEATERVALFLFRGNYYVSGFMLLRYGDNWKITGAYSPISSTALLGTPLKTTEADFAALTNGS